MTPTPDKPAEVPAGFVALFAAAKAGALCPYPHPASGHTIAEPNLHVRALIEDVIKGREAWAKRAAGEVEMSMGRGGPMAINLDAKIARGLSALEDLRFALAHFERQGDGVGK